MLGFCDSVLELRFYLPWLGDKRCDSPQHPCAWLAEKGCRALVAQPSSLPCAVTARAGGLGQRLWPGEPTPLPSSPTASPLRLRSCSPPPAPSREGSVLCSGEVFHEELFVPASRWLQCLRSAVLPRGVTGGFGVRGAAGPARQPPWCAGGPFSARLAMFAVGGSPWVGRPWRGRPRSPCFCRVRGMRMGSLLALETCPCGYRSADGCPSRYWRSVSITPAVPFSGSGAFRSSPVAGSCGRAG